MLLAITCATENYMPSAKFQMNTAYKYGKVDNMVIYDISNDIDENFRNKNEKILNAGEGRRKGYYLWKPYFVNRALSTIDYGDYLVYMDAGGLYYKSSVYEAVKYMGKKGIDMIGSCNRLYKNKDWTKRDAFIFMDCDTEKYINEYQCHAALIIMKKTPKTEKIIGEWLDYAQNYNIISEASNICGKENYEGFVEHRHDQSILSLLMTKYEVPMIEQMPIPKFGYYHHTMGTSVKEIQKIKRQERMQEIVKLLRRKKVRGIWYLERNNFLEIIPVQRIYKKIKYRHKNNN